MKQNPESFENPVQSSNLTQLDSPYNRMKKLHP